MPNPGESTRVTNIGSRPWSDMYANMKYIAAPGQEVIAPFEAVCLWFGHPDAVDLGEPDKNYRTDELKRLRIRYGVLDVAVEDPDSGHVNKSTEPCHPIGQDEQWERNKPHIEVNDIMGNRIVTVVEDPEGRSITPASQTLGQQELLVEQLARMQEQMAQMQAQLDATRRQEQATADSGPIDADDPIVAPPSPGTPPPVAEVATPEEVTEDSPTRVRVGSKS